MAEKSICRRMLRSNILDHDLDHPPVVIRTARWKMILLFVACAVFVFGGFKMIQDPRAHWVGYMSIIFFGLGLLIAIWQMVLPAWLELSPGGLRWFTGRKIERYSWNDFLEFRTYSPSFSRHVGFVLVPQSTKRTNASAISRNMLGLDGGFGGSWTLNAGELAALLNRAREKWG